MPAPAEQITQWLNEARKGSRTAADHLMEAVYSDLRGVARRAMALERPDHTLQPTALVHEAYLRIFEGAAAADWQNALLRCGGLTDAPGAGGPRAGDSGC
jgi:DNA-directed RNA polymerase specialized sigma24 family protein